MVGVSLGAHILGQTGKQVLEGKIDTMFGLDPAGNHKIIFRWKLKAKFDNISGPLFSLGNTDNRLNRGDANYVEIIHTNVGGFGLGGPTADVDIYVNGGASQPGCVLANCNHMRSASLYIESINSDQLVARRCNTVTEAQVMRCTGGQPGLVLGGEPSNSKRNVSGIFSLRTYRSAPFGMGPNFEWNWIFLWLINGFERLLCLKLISLSSGIDFWNQYLIFETLKIRDNKEANF